MKPLLLCLLLTGCATQQPTVWGKEGATQEDLNTDHGYCTAQAFQNTMNLTQALIIQSGCMRGRGWRRTQ